MGLIVAGDFVRHLCATIAQNYPCNTVPVPHSNTNKNTLKAPLCALRDKSAVQFSTRSAAAPAAAVA